MMLKKGFTLIELLIVIAIIGILAGGLIVALNPIEQINKGRDTRIIAQAKEVLDACERWYVANGSCAGTCAALAGGTAPELKTATPCNSVSVFGCSATGTCTMTTTTISSAYYRAATRCGVDARCVIPTEITAL